MLGEKVTKCKAPAFRGLPVTRERKRLDEEPTSKQQTSVCYNEEQLDSPNADAKVGGPTGDRGVPLTLS